MEDNWEKINRKIKNPRAVKMEFGEIRTAILAAGVLVILNITGWIWMNKNTESRNLTSARHETYMQAYNFSLYR